MKTFALDKNESALLEKQTTYVMSKVYETKHKPLRALSIFAINTEIASGSEYVEWTYTDEVGAAKIIADYTHDFPDVEILSKKATGTIRGIGNKYHWSIPEIRRAQRAGVQLDVKRGITAKRFHDVKHDSIAWTGDAKHGLQGFIGYPGNTEVVIANGTLGSKLWANKTADEIIKDVRAMISAGRTLTNSLETYDTFLMPQENYDLIESMPRSSESEVTVLNYLKDTYPDITLWMGLNEMTGVGAGGTNRMYCFNRSAENLEYGIPQPFEQQDPEKKGMVYEVLCHSESAGIMEYNPTIILYADGV